MHIRSIAFLALMTLAPAVWAQTPEDTAPETPQEQSGELAPLAVPAKPDSAATALPPFPSMMNAITTEKPVRGVSAGVVPRERTRAAVSSPDDPGKPSAAGPGQPAPAKRRPSDTFMEERSLFNTPTANFRTAKVIIDEEYNLVGMVYGEQFGYLHILDADGNGDFTESWKSPPLNGEIRGVFVANLDRTGEAEIVAYTANGNIFVYGYDSHEMKFRTTDGLYKRIDCMLVANLDASPELELLFITDTGKMIQFDPISKFEEWTSTETYTATDMALGNVDNDPGEELILNTGEIINFQFKAMKWKMDAVTVGADSRLYLIDVDRDGILELVVEYTQQYIRIFDIDQRHEKW